VSLGAFPPLELALGVWVWQQSVATPQAARGWACPPCRHLKIQSWVCGAALGGKLERRWVILRARWVALRARWVALRAR
jgi:hypothetical protein